MTSLQKGLFSLYDAFLMHTEGIGEKGLDIFVFDYTALLYDYLTASQEPISLTDFPD
jgi:hypothetical protein